MHAYKESVPMALNFDTKRSNFFSIPSSLCSKLSLNFKISLLFVVMATFFLHFLKPVKVKAIKTVIAAGIGLLETREPIHKQTPMQNANLRMHQTGPKNAWTRNVLDIKRKNLLYDILLMQTKPVMIQKRNRMRDRRLFLVVPT